MISLLLCDNCLEARQLPPFKVFLCLRLFLYNRLANLTSYSLYPESPLSTEADYPEWNVKYYDWQVTTNSPAKRRCRLEKSLTGEQPGRDWQGSTLFPEFEIELA